MHSAPEALRAIPENRYAEQLRRGFRFLRFSQPLEQEYHQYISKVQARYQKIAVLLGLGIWMIFSLVDALRLDLWQRFPDYPAALWGLLLVRGSIIFTLCLLALLLLNGSRKHYGPQVVTVTLLSLVLGTTLTIIFYQNLSVPISNSVLLLMAITLFFPLGLSFRGNLLLAAASLPLVVAPGLWLLSETQQVDHLRLCFIFSLALLICAMGAYVRDHTQREQFLLLQLLDIALHLLKLRTETLTGSPVFGHGSVIVFYLHEQIGQITMVVLIGRVQLASLSITGDSIGRLTQSIEMVAIVILELGVIWLDSHQGGKLLIGLSALTELLVAI